MKLFTSGAAIVLALCTASCASDKPYRDGTPRASTTGKEYALRAPPMDPSRRIVELNCSNTFYTDGGNLRCM